jgi:hypothetical protein
MLDVIDKTACCACSSCVYTCPRNCISLIEDLEGFSYPRVNKELCVNCGLCEQVCPVLNCYLKNKSPLNVYAAKSLDLQLKIESSSGGIFSLISEYILKRQGVVFGAKFDSEWNVVHDYTETIEGLAAFRKSKYVQSNLGDSFLKVKSFLSSGRLVLFSGTPCQIAGLKRFLNKHYENLLLIDVVCHGVPSPKIWKMYLNDLIKKENVRRNERYTIFDIVDIDFRNKKKGWKNFCFELSLMHQNGIRCILEPHYLNVFMKGFFRDIYIRPSCTKCVFKSGRSGSDITLGDFWGISLKNPTFDDDWGVSLALVNTSSGKKYFESLEVEKIEVDYSFALETHKSLYSSVSAHKNKTIFFNKLQQNTSVIKLIDTYATLPLKISVINKMSLFSRKTGIHVVLQFTKKWIKDLMGKYK